MTATAPNRELRLIDCSEAEHAAAILDILNEAIVNSAALYDYLPRPPQAMAAWFATKRAGGCIDAANTASIGLHQRLGFVHAGTFMQVGFKFGRWLDAAFYQLNLETPAQPRDG